MFDVKLLLDETKSIMAQLSSIRRQIHSNPELSFMEFNTSKLIQDVLSAHHISFETVIDTGVIATIGSGDKCIALRADIDALPLGEETNCDFSSRNPGIMHACGHDLHTTMLIGAAMLLKKHEKELNGTVKLIFQPGEEKLPGGAIKLLEAGALDSPKPSMIFGQHVNPDELCGTISIAPGTIMASADELYWTISGSGSHAAQPHKGSDPVMASASIITQLQLMLNKVKDPLQPLVLSVTSIHGGSATNIIPGEVRLLGTLRTFDNALRMDMLANIARLSSSVALSFGCSSLFEPVTGYPPLTNSDPALSIANGSATALFGDVAPSRHAPLMWAEDFAHYSATAGIPSCFWLLGVRPAIMPTMPGLHEPRFLPEDDAMFNGTAMLASVAFRSLVY